MHMIIDVTKDKTVFSLHLNDKPDPIKVNIETGEITSFTGRIVKNFPREIQINYAIEKLKSYGYRELITHLSNIKRLDNWEKIELSRLEMWFNVLDKVDTILEECPKGYLKWIEDNNLRINRKSLIGYKWYKTTKNYAKEDLKIIEPMRKYLSGYYVDDFDYELWKVIIRLYKNQIKNFEMSLYLGRDLKGFISSIVKLPKETRDKFIAEVLDKNRDFAYNKKVLDEYTNKERNAIIIAQEDRIREITNINSDDFCIIVPKTLEDFSNEGRQQNNCVGYYYHDSIARGENVIYFIRKKSNPTHSYITCRYHIITGYTVESRIVNNGDVRDASARSFIKEIDQMITKLLNNSIE